MRKTIIILVCLLIISAETNKTPEKAVEVVSVSFTPSPTTIITKHILQLSPSLEREKAEKYSLYIYENCKKYKVDFKLVLAVIAVESNFREEAISRKGAVGLMQVTTRAAEDTGSKADQKLLQNNLEIGVKYLASLIERFDDLELALAAYNRGPTRVRKEVGQGKLPRAYATKVLDRYEEICNL